MSSYVVYCVSYTGTNLSAKYYIGYTTQEKAISGKYFGSISSKKWKDLYFTELANHPEVFHFKILSYHNSRDSALKEELRLQIEKDVVNSDEYFNESYSKVNGSWGSRAKQSEERIKNRSQKNTGKKRTEEAKQRMSEAQKGKRNRAGKPCSEETKQKLRELRKLQVFTPEQIEKRRLACTGKPRKIISCPHCGKNGGGGAMNRFHFDNCKNIKHI